MYSDLQLQLTRSGEKTVTTKPETEFQNVSRKGFWNAGQNNFAHFITPHPTWDVGLLEFTFPRKIMTSVSNRIYHGQVRGS